jgi:ATP-binding cassette subfamily C protein
VLKNLLPSKPGTEPLADALKACRTHFVWAFVFSALVNLLYLTPTLYMMQVYYRVVPTGGLTTLVLITAVAVFALAALGSLDWLRGRLMLRAGLRLDRLLSAKVLARVVDLQARSPNTQALREFDNVRGAIGGQGMLALFDAPWTPIYLLCCFLLHPAIGVLTLVGGIILFALAPLAAARLAVDFLLGVVDVLELNADGVASLSLASRNFPIPSRLVANRTTISGERLPKMTQKWF